MEIKLCFVLSSKILAYGVGKHMIIVSWCMNLPEISQRLIGLLKKRPVGVRLICWIKLTNIRNRDWSPIFLLKRIIPHVWNKTLIFALHFEPFQTWFFFFPDSWHFTEEAPSGRLITDLSGFMDLMFNQLFEQRRSIYIYNFWKNVLLAAVLLHSFYLSISFIKSSK